jgi:hypothetical protein
VQAETRAGQTRPTRKTIEQQKDYKAAMENAFAKAFSRWDS